jgi:hypothetical protein
VSRVLVICIRLLAPAFAFCACLLVPVPRASRAATVVPLTLEQMGRIAVDEIVGTVENTRAQWDKDHRLIETHVRIRVEQRLKGRGGPTITVVVPGGIVGKIGMLTPGAAAFQRGERVLLLAEPRGPGEARPVGLFQGKLRVRHDPARGIDVVEPPGPAWGSHGEPIAPGTIPVEKPPALPLDEVVRRLRGTP